MKTRIRQGGFTIIELMITIAVLGVLLALAVPNMRDLVIRNRLTTRTNALVAAMQLARSEAIKRGVPITVLSISGNTNWAVQGWAVGLNLNNDSDFADAGEVEFRREDAVTGNSTLTGSVAAIQFFPNGGTNNFSALTLCTTDIAIQNQRRISVSISGHMQTVKADNPSCT